MLDCNTVARLDGRESAGLEHVGVADWRESTGVEHGGEADAWESAGLEHEGEAGRAGGECWERGC